MQVAGKKRPWVLLLMMLCAPLFSVGCGTTRMSDTSRTGSEQLLLSNAIDRAINNMDFSVLAGREVFLDPQYLKGVVDENYVVSSLRQAMLAHGCYLKERREDAKYVVEARAGAVGTNRHELLIGVPQITMPNMGNTAGIPSTIPEIPFAKSTDQKGVAKLACYAYYRETGEPVWQSGAFPVLSTAKDTWVLGTGPFQKGTIYDGTRFAGSKLRLMPPLLRRGDSSDDEIDRMPPIPVTAEAVFPQRPRLSQLPESSSPPERPAAPSGEATPQLNGAGSDSSGDAGGSLGATGTKRVGGAADADVAVSRYSPSRGIAPTTEDAAWLADSAKSPPSGQVLRMPTLDQRATYHEDDVAMFATPGLLAPPNILPVPGILAHWLDSSNSSAGASRSIEAAPAGSSGSGSGYFPRAEIFSRTDLWRPRWWFSSTADSESLDTAEPANGTAAALDSTALAD